MNSYFTAKKLLFDEKLLRQAYLKLVLLCGANVLLWYSELGSTNVKLSS